MMHMHANHVQSGSLNSKYKQTKEKEKNSKLTKPLDECDWTKLMGLDNVRTPR